MATPDIRLIAAVGRRGQLGLGGRLPWHDPEDLRWFRTVTMGDVVVVGHRTAQTLPELPGRTVVVDDPAFHPLAFLVTQPCPSHVTWIAGGAKTYARWFPFVRRCVVTLVDYDGPADVWMPPLWSIDVTDSEKRILDIWDQVVDENDDDASTELLMSMTADRAGVGYGDVASALQRQAEHQARGAR